MASTLLLDPATWDLVLDGNGDIALSPEPASLAQDAASAIRTFGDVGGPGVGECYFDTSLGVPYLTTIFGKRPPLTLIKQLFVEAALTVPDVVSAVVYISALTNRALSGQVQVTSASGQTSAANFTVINPQAA